MTCLRSAPARQAGDSVAARRQTAAIIAISGTDVRQLEQIQIRPFVDSAKAPKLKQLLQ
jgi:hypothetical protein